MKEYSLEQLRELLKTIVNKYNTLEADNIYLLRDIKKDSNVIGQTHSIYSTADEILRWDILVNDLEKLIKDKKAEYDFTLIEEIEKKYTTPIKTLDEYLETPAAPYRNKICSAD